MPSLAVESWLWYGFVLLIALSRYISRYMTLGSLRKYQADDWCMLVALCFYTNLIATINIVRHTNSNLLPPGYDIEHLTAEDKADREYGSKLILVVEQSQCVTIWSAKLCLLILYNRLTSLRWENIGIKVLAGYVIVSFIVMEVLYFGVWCQPFSNYWAVPTPNVQCDAATNHLITNATFNLTSDTIMIAIALPMFVRLRMPWQKKVPLLLVFSLGLFVILAAILNKVYSFTEPFGSMWTYWYVRESSTALLVTNLPFVWGLARKITGLKSINGASRWGTNAHPEMAESSGHNDSTRHNSITLPVFLTEWKDHDTECSGFPRLDSKSGDLAESSRREQQWRSEPSSANQPPCKAVTVDAPLQETVRRDSNPEKRQSTTPRSSALPSLDTNRSVGSFV